MLVEIGDYIWIALVLLLIASCLITVTIGSMSEPARKESKEAEVFRMNKGDPI